MLVQCNEMIWTSYMSSKEKSNRYLFPDIAVSLIAFLVSKEMYSKWGPAFLDKNTDEISVIVSKRVLNKECFLPAAKILHPNVIPAYSGHDQLKSYFSYYIMKQFGPTAIWNTYTFQEYLRMKLSPSPINKFRIDVWFLNLPFDGEVSIAKKIF